MLTWILSITALSLLDDLVAPDDRATQYVDVILPGSRLFHGTIESIEGILKPGAYDAVLWTADTPAIAQAYIPCAGMTTWIPVDMLRLPSKDPQVQHVQHAIGIFYDLDEVRWDRRGRPQSWSMPRGAGRIPSAEELNTRLQRIGFEPQQGHGQWALYEFEFMRDQLLRPGRCATGTLYIGTVQSPLRIFDMTLRGEVEHDLMNPQYHALPEFRALEERGYDGIRIRDFLQSKIWGNVGHDSIGLFRSSIDKLAWEMIPAKNFDPEEHDWGNTSEYQAWVTQAQGAGSS